MTRWQAILQPRIRGRGRVYFAFCPFQDAISSPEGERRDERIYKQHHGRVRWLTDADVDPSIKA